MALLFKYDNFDAFPDTGASGAWYADKKAGKVYFWNGANYEYLKRYDATAGDMLADDYDGGEPDGVVNEAETAQGAELAPDFIANAPAGDLEAGDFLLLSDTSDGGLVKKMTPEQLFKNTFRPVISVNIATNLDNWAPVGLVAGVWIKATTAGVYQLTGIDAAGFKDGDFIYLTNLGSQTLKVKNNNAASLANNRFLLDNDINIKPYESRTIARDGVLNRWLIF